MESYGHVSICKCEKYDCYLMRCILKNVQYTPLKWVIFLADIKKSLLRIKESHSITNFILQLDITHLDMFMSSDRYEEFTNVIKLFKELFMSKLLGSIVYIESNVCKFIINMSMKFYLPIKPLFILNHSLDVTNTEPTNNDAKIIDDLNNNIKNENEYIIK